MSEKTIPIFPPEMDRETLLEWATARYPELLMLDVEHYIEQFERSITEDPSEQNFQLWSCISAARELIDQELFPE